MTSTTFDRPSTPPIGTASLVHLLFATDATWTATLLRLVLGLVIFPHGAQKLFGWFGGYGFQGTMGYFQSLGIPSVFGVLAIAAETLGAVALIFGAATRIAAFALAVNLTVAALMVHLPFGFFANWYGNQKGEGIEYHILAVALALGVTALGGGRLSVDRQLSR